MDNEIIDVRDTTLADRVRLVNVIVDNGGTIYPTSRVTYGKVFTDKYQKKPKYSLEDIYAPR